MARKSVGLQFSGTLLWCLGKYCAPPPFLTNLSDMTSDLHRIVIGCIFFIVFVFIIVDVVVISKKPYNLVSLIGMATYIFTFFIFSKNPKKVNT